MRVRSAYSKSADTCTTRFSIGVPFRAVGIDVERTVFEIELWIRRLEIQCWGELSMPDDVGGMNEPGYASGDIEVTDVRLHRANRAETLARGACTESLGRCREFKWI